MMQERELDQPEPKTRPSARRRFTWLMVSGLVLASIAYLALGKPRSRPAIPRAIVAPAPTTPRGNLQCTVPALPEGVLSKDIHAGRVDVQFEGGEIEPGKYRLVDAIAANAEFTPGRWSLGLDLGEEHQGAFYRPMGLSARSSRIRWAIRGNEFSFETVCPDAGEAHRYAYAVVDGRLHLRTNDAIVLVLEPYSDSAVSAIPPIP